MRASSVWGRICLTVTFSTFISIFIPDLSYGATSGTLPAFDDGSSQQIPLGFTDLNGDPTGFTFYGQTYDSIYINNNGNITFDDPLSAYTPNAFPSVGPPMIAPFWADVDTRNGKGTVTYTSNDGSFTVNWTDVGYYNATSDSNTDSRNTFYVTIQRNNGIIFHYGDMSWTTGDASGGNGGLGGAPATLGINAGDGTRSKALAQFSDSNVSSLNGTTWFFQTDNADLQPQAFKQFDPSWGTKPTLNSATDIMKNTGCFVTSTAMVLTALGHNTDPGKLDDFLSASMSGGNLGFASFPQNLFYGQTDNVPGPPVRFGQSAFSVTQTPGPLPPTGDQQLKDAIVQQISTAISQFGPIILRVPSRNYGTHLFLAGETHAIVAYGVTADGDILIHDPGWSGSPGTLSGYVTFVNNYVKNVKKQPTWQLTNSDGQIGGQDFSFLAQAKNFYTYAQVLTPISQKVIQGQANSPVDFVYTDSQGRKEGFDPVTNTQFNQIPGSFYFREAAPDNAADNAPLDPVISDKFPPIFFRIGDPLQGVSSLQVFGDADGPWSVDFGVSDPVRGFNPEQFSFQGNALNGSFQQFAFDVPSSSIASVSLPSAFSSSFATLSLLGFLSLVLRRKSLHQEK